MNQVKARQEGAREDDKAKQDTIVVDKGKSSMVEGENEVIVQPAEAEQIINGSVLKWKIREKNCSECLGTLAETRPSNLASACLGEQLKKCVSLRRSTPSLLALRLVLFTMISGLLMRNPLLLL